MQQAFRHGLLRARPPLALSWIAKGTKMKIDSNDFRVRPGKKVDLREWPTIVKPFCKSKKAYQRLLGDHVEGLSSLQRLHYEFGATPIETILTVLGATLIIGSHVLNLRFSKRCECCDPDSEEVCDEGLTR